MTVIGELVYTFLLPEEKPHLRTRYEEQLVPLKYGGTRKVQLEVITMSGIPKVTEVQVALLNADMCDKLTGELYYEIKQGQKTMMRESPYRAIQGYEKCWVVAKNGFPPNKLTLSIQILSTDYSMVNPEEMKKKNTFALAEDCATVRKSGLMSDVTIVCEEERFPAHKLILSARSKVFAAMFNQTNTVEEQQAWLPDGYSQILGSYVFGPFGLLDYGSATLRCKI